MEKNKLLANLIKIDEEVSLLFEPTNVKIKIVITGGGAFLLKGLISRSTPDIDVLNGYKQIEFILNKYNANTRVNAYSDCFAYNYEDRLEKVELKTKMLEYYVLSTEDLIISKLFSFRPKDIEDIKSTMKKGVVNLNKLIQIVDSGEVKNACLSDRHYDEFMFNYNKFLKEYRK